MENAKWATAPIKKILNTPISIAESSPSQVEKVYNARRPKETAARRWV